MQVEWIGTRPKHYPTTVAIVAGATDYANRNSEGWAHWGNAVSGVSVLWPDFTAEEFEAHRQGYCAAAMDDHNRQKRDRERRAA